MLGVLYEVFDFCYYLRSGFHYRPAHYSESYLRSPGLEKVKATSFYAGLVMPDNA
jgi:hypothetical protein